MWAEGITFTIGIRTGGSVTTGHGTGNAHGISGDVVGSVAFRVVHESNVRTAVGSNTTTGAILDGLSALRVIESDHDSTLIGSLGSVDTEVSVVVVDVGDGSLNGINVLLNEDVTGNVASVRHLVTQNVSGCTTTAAKRSITANQSGLAHGESLRRRFGEDLLQREVVGRKTNDQVLRNNPGLTRNDHDAT